MLKFFFSSPPPPPITPVCNVRLHTGWYQCNFACPYCVAATANPERFRSSKLLRYAEPSSLPEVEKWQAERFRRICSNIARLPYHLNIRPQVAGEIFLNKPLLRELKQLALADNVVSMNIITNLSFSKEQYARALDGIDHKKWAFVASFHATEVDFEHWRETALYMHKHYDFSVIMVAWPPLLAQLETYKKQLEELGLTVFVQAFIGEHEGRYYPRDYSVEARELLRRLSYSRHDYEFLVELKRPGLCHAGHTSLHVDPSGVVRPCGQGMYPYTLGDLSQEARVNLHDGPRPCPFQTCQCDTENMNTAVFQAHYLRPGINQHRYIYRFSEQAKTHAALDEWNIAY